MTNEDIEKAVRGSIEVGENNAGWCEHESEMYHDGFVDGAKWRINSIWHDVNEKPRRNTWYIAQIGNDAFDTFTDSENWDNYALGLNMIRWAYIEDLIPNMEDKA